LRNRNDGGLVTAAANSNATADRGNVNALASWGAALRSRTAGSQNESRCSAIHKQRPYQSNTYWQQCEWGGSETRPYVRVTAHKEFRVELRDILVCAQDFQPVER
jgi:hypothetical protein